MAYDTPNYQPMGGMDINSLLSFLNPGQQHLSEYDSGKEIAGYFGFKGDKYGKYFDPVNLSGIQEGLSAIPDLQNFLFSGARNEYSQNKGGLLDKIGKTNLAGSGSFQGDWNKMDNQFTNKMYSADKQIQDLIQGYQNQLNTEIGGLYNSAQSLLGSGAKSKGGYGSDGFDWNNPVRG